MQTKALGGLLWGVEGANALLSKAQNALANWVWNLPGPSQTYIIPANSPQAIALQALDLPMKEITRQVEVPVNLMKNQYKLVTKKYYEVKVSPEVIAFTIGEWSPVILTGVGALGGVTEGAGLARLGTEAGVPSELAGESLSVRLGAWLASKAPWLFSWSTPERLIEAGEALRSVGYVGNMIDVGAWMGRATAEALSGMGELLSRVGVGEMRLGARIAGPLGEVGDVWAAPREFQEWWFNLPRYAQYWYGLRSVFGTFVTAVGGTTEAFGGLIGPIGRGLAEAFPMPWERVVVGEVLPGLSITTTRVEPLLTEFGRAVRGSPPVPNVLTTFPVVEWVGGSKPVFRTYTAELTGLERYGWVVGATVRTEGGEVINIALPVPMRGAVADLTGIEKQLESFLGQYVTRQFGAGAKIMSWSYEPLWRAAVKGVPQLEGLSVWVTPSRLAAARNVVLELITNPEFQRINAAIPWYLPTTNPRLYRALQEAVYTGVYSLANYPPSVLRAGLIPTMTGTMSWLYASRLAETGVLPEELGNVLRNAEAFINLYSNERLINAVGRFWRLPAPPSLGGAFDVLINPIELRGVRSLVVMYGAEVPTFFGYTRVFGREIEGPAAGLPWKMITKGMLNNPLTPTSVGMLRAVGSSLFGFNVDVSEDLLRRLSLVESTILGQARLGEFVNPQAQSRLFTDIATTINLRPALGRFNEEVVSPAIGIGEWEYGLMRTARTSGIRAGSLLGGVPFTAVGGVGALKILDRDAAPFGALGIDLGALMSLVKTTGDAFSALSGALLGFIKAAPRALGGLASTRASRSGAPPSMGQTKYSNWSPQNWFNNPFLSSRPYRQPQLPGDILGGLVNLAWYLPSPRANPPRPRVWTSPITATPVRTRKALRQLQLMSVLSPTARSLAMPTFIVRSVTITGTRTGTSGGTTTTGAPATTTPPKAAGMPILPLLPWWFLPPQGVRYITSSSRGSRFMEAIRWF